MLIRSVWVVAACLGLLLPTRALFADDVPRPVKIVLIAGKKSHGPGEHEYEKGCRLLKHCLETSPNVPKGIETVVVAEGWPADEKVFEGASTVLLFSDGSDRDEKNHPLLHGDRLQKMQKLMDQGVGFISIHYTIFIPTERGGRQFQEWVGGYFDYDSAGTPKDRKTWYSTLGHATTTSTIVTPAHPLARGVKPFTTRTEYYWKIRFKEDDRRRRTPILTFDPKAPGTEALVAWAVERGDGGRGFGFTGGHFHSNWRIEGFRKLVLNALLWTARVEVPEGGVESSLPTGENVLPNGDGRR